MAETVVGSLELDGFPLGEIEATVEHGRISFDYGTGEAWRGQSYTLRTAGGRTIEFVVDRLHVDQSDAYGETEVVHGSVIRMWDAVPSTETVPTNGLMN